jgi:hypothetical protein
MVRATSPVKTMEVADVTVMPELAPTFANRRSILIVLALTASGAFRLVTVKLPIPPMVVPTFMFRFVRTIGEPMSDQVHGGGFAPVGGGLGMVAMIPAPLGIPGAPPTKSNQ